MIETVSAGDLGLDVLLGGGFRLIERLSKTKSATILVRGSAGAGKTLVGLHAAIELARALGGDVAVGCVEILPSEYMAQMRSARPDVDEGRVATLPGRAVGAAGPRIYCGLLTDLDPQAPDLVASLEALGHDVTAAGGKPAVFIVDSLIEGYGLGASVPRAGADAVMKFAAQGGHGLVLCEETQGTAASPWVFAADTVLELGVEARERGRWIEIRKHRFGASVSGRHEIDLGSGAHPEVFPEPSAWVTRDLHDVLRRHGWEYGDRDGIPVLVWEQRLKPRSPERASEPPLEGAFIVIGSQESGVARSLAYGLLPAASAAHGPGEQAAVLAIELDPLAVHEDVAKPGHEQICHLHTVHGPARALRTLVDQFALAFDPERHCPSVARVVIGDLDVVRAPDERTWMEAFRVFASLVIASRWGVPVVTFASGQHLPLSTYADLTIRAGQHNADAVHRWQRDPHRLEWGIAVTSVPLAVDAFSRPSGRMLGR